MDLLAVLIYSHKADYQALLEWQLKQEGIETLHVVDPDFSWRRRQLRTLETAQAYPDRLLVFPDAWDTVLLGTKSELTLLGLPGRVTLAGAKACWPDPVESLYRVKQGPSVGPWRYINSNPLAGLGRDIASAIEWGLDHKPLTGDSSDVRTPDGEVCERFWTNIYLHGPDKLNVRIDSGCEMNQTFLCSEPGELQIVQDIQTGNRRLRNCVTGSLPIFFHLNGKHLLPDGLIEL